MSYSIVQNLSIERSVILHGSNDARSRWLARHRHMKSFRIFYDIHSIAYNYYFYNHMGNYPDIWLFNRKTIDFDRGGGSRTLDI